MIFIERIDAVPLAADKFSPEYRSWVSVLVDTLNGLITLVEDSINHLKAPSYTTTEITALAVTDANGSFYYDTDTNELKAKVNGVVVVLA